MAHLPSGCQLALAPCTAPVADGACSSLGLGWQAAVFRSAEDYGAADTLLTSLRTKWAADTAVASSCGLSNTSGLASSAIAYLSALSAASGSAGSAPSAAVHALLADPSSAWAAWTGYTFTPDSGGSSVTLGLASKVDACGSAPQAAAALSMVEGSSYGAAEDRHVIMASTAGSGTAWLINTLSVAATIPQLPTLCMRCKFVGHGQ